MAFKFYIVDPDQGEVFGTDSADVAKEAAEDDAFFVIDAEEALFMVTPGESVEIVDFEAESDDEDELDDDDYIEGSDE